MELAKANDDATVIDGANCTWPRVTAITKETTGPQWHIASCFAGSERTTAELLARHRFQIYAPIIETMKPVAQRFLSKAQRLSNAKAFKSVREAMFPGYMFVRFGADHPARHEIFKLMGVRGLMGRGAPAVVADELIDGLKAKEIGGAIPGTFDLKAFMYEIGETVRVTSGPFALFSAIVEQLPDGPINTLDESARVKCLVNIFGRQSPVELALSQIEKL